MQGNESAPVRRLAALLVVGGLVVILYTTLFPFDFYNESSFPGLFTRFDTGLASSGEADWFRNLLLFMPVSFGLACLLAGGGRRWFAVSGLILVLCLALSFAVEVLQLFLQERESTLTDVMSNGAGALVSLLVFAVWRERPLQRIANGIGVAVRRVEIKSLLAVYAGYTMLLVLLVNHLFNGASLATWNPAYPLLLGNEATGDRPWQGAVTNLAFFSDPEPAGLYRLAFWRPVEQEANSEPFVASYPLTGTAALHDGMGQLPDLVWQGSAPAATERGGIVFTGNSWLSTVTPVKVLNDNIAHNGQFTLTATVATAHPAQAGPARIVSLSNGPFQRNLTLGQDGADLVVRLRTGLSGENGLYPELRVTNVFADTNLHQIVVAYSGHQFRIHVDGSQPTYGLDLGPPFALFTYLRPVDQWVVRIDRAPLWVYYLLYSGIILGPVGVVLGLMAYKSGRNAVRQAARIGMAVLLTPWLLDRVSAFYHQPLYARLGQFWLGVLMTAGMTACTYRWLSGWCPSHQPEKLSKLR